MQKKNQYAEIYVQVEGVFHLADGIKLVMSKEGSIQVESAEGNRALVFGFRDWRDKFDLHKAEALIGFVQEFINAFEEKFKKVVVTEE